MGNNGHQHDEMTKDDTHWALAASSVGLSTTPGISRVADSNSRATLARTSRDIDLLVPVKYCYSMIMIRIMMIKMLSTWYHGLVLLTYFWSLEPGWLASPWGWSSISDQIIMMIIMMMMIISTSSGSLAPSEHSWHVGGDRGTPTSPRRSSPNPGGSSLIESESWGIIINWVGILGYHH